MSTTTSPNGHRPTGTGLWLPASLRQVEHTAGRADEPVAAALPSPSLSARPASARETGTAAQTGSRETTPARPAADESVSDPVAVRHHYDQQADQEATRIRREATDRTSNLLGWLVAILAGLLSLEGFRLFGDLLGWPPIASVPGTGWVLMPLVTLWFTIDVIAFVAMKQWLNPAFSKSTRELGMRVSVAALSISVVINAVGHGFDGGPYAWVAVPAAALPPALLWAVLFLRDRRIRDVHDQIAQARQRAAQAADEALAPQPQPSASTPKRATKSQQPRSKSPKTSGANPSSKPRPAAAGPEQSDAELVRQLRALDTELGRKAGSQTATTRLGIGRSRLGRIRRLADQQPQSEYPTSGESSE